MATLIIAVVFVSILHFIYEGIWLPSFRLSKRYELFALRDRLRALRTKAPDELDRLAYLYLQDSLNVSVNYLSQFDFACAIQAKRFLKENPSIKKKSENRYKVINSCSNEEFQSIFNKALKIATVVFLANNLAILLYLSPLILILWIVRKLNKYIQKFNYYLRRLIALTETDYETNFKSRQCIGLEMLST
jgi:hypothetical protein